jgi:ectoine hydroxylase-related dioxygenase (phytanoyl-CoA dioxygenase family)
VSATHAMSHPDVRDLIDGVYRDGIVGIREALPPAWADQLHEDFDALFAEARSYEGGTVNRGRNRFYFAVHPERLRGFLDLVTHPTLTALCDSLLGPHWKVVEVAFDVPLPGALHQRWHRDFPMPPETRRERRLTSLALNATTVDVTPEMGPFEIAPGTQWDDDASFEHGMFPPLDGWERYERLRRQRLARRGDVSARTGLAIHRGTPNDTDRSRPVLILGVNGPEADFSAHDLVVSRRYAESLPPEVRDRLWCRVVDRLEPIVQKHTIEGLVMGE